MAHDYEDLEKSTLERAELKTTELEKEALKLFVVGELSGDPSRWSRFSKRSFVLASTREQAIKMAESSVVCAEVDCSQPLVLCRDEGCSEFSNLAVLVEAAIGDQPVES